MKLNVLQWMYLILKYRKALLYYAIELFMKCNIAAIFNIKAQNS